jgi:hypothetical protein
MNQLQNGVTLLLIAIVVLSLLQGVWRGGSGSARRLFLFAAETLFTLASMALAAWAAAMASPRVHAWLAVRTWNRPLPDASAVSQWIHTLATGLRDLPVLRFSVLFLVAYLVLRAAMGLVGGLIARIGALPLSLLPSGGVFGRLAGGAFGAALGAARALMLAAVLFGYCALFPKGPFVDDIQASEPYRRMAEGVIRPAAGKLLETTLPVFTSALQDELQQLWQRRYDVIDAQVPAELAKAALAITEGHESDEAKARALYEWVGTRIAYDHEKVRAYEERGEWRDQTPADTFRTRKGVCIDYARLYAAMARAAGLEARVVTGLGFDGRGSYGPHAWNEVYLREKGVWVPLDPTWAQAGDWFNPPNFAETHIERA